MSQTMLAYIGAVIIVVGASMVMYAPDLFYQGDAHIAASAVIDQTAQSDAGLAQTTKQ